MQIITQHSLKRNTYNYTLKSLVTLLSSTTPSYIRHHSNIFIHVGHSIIFVKSARQFLHKLRYAKIDFKNFQKPLDNCSIALCVRGYLFLKTILSYKINYGRSFNIFNLIIDGEIKRDLLFTCLCSIGWYINTSAQIVK